MYVCMYVRMYVCIYVCMYGVCMYVCMYVCLLLTYGILLSVALNQQRINVQALLHTVVNSYNNQLASALSYAPKQQTKTYQVFTNP